MNDKNVLEETARQIETLQNRRNTLLREVDEVNLELGWAVAKYGRLVNEKAPMSKLPNELLAMIFQMYQKMWMKGSQKKAQEVVVSHVSFRWREVALNTPLLWNDIILDVSRKSVQKHKLQRLATYLTRSDECLLYIDMRIADVGDISQYIRLIVPHAMRWRRVSISSVTSQVRDVYEMLRLVASPTLEHLSLRIGREPCPRRGILEDFPAILIHGAPLLSFVRLAGAVAGNIQPPLVSVTTLHIDTCSSNQINDSQFRGMLKALPCLANLSLTGIDISRDPFKVPTPISLPTLRSLRIRGSGIRRLLSLVPFPHLEFLSILGTYVVDPMIVQTLRSLTLDEGGWLTNNITNIIRAFPNISDLNMEHPHRGVYGLLESESVSGLLWPGLETLSLRALRVDEVMLLRSMVLNRLNLCKPLGKLRLDRQSRILLRRDDGLTALRSLVSVENCDYPDAWPPDLEYEDPDDV